MKIRDIYSIINRFLLTLIVISPGFSCRNGGSQLTTGEGSVVRDGVRQMAANIANDISTKGPKAWLEYFEDDPGFFMVSDGKLVFKDYASAKRIVLNTVAKKISKITLSWKNERIDPSTPAFASFGADFHEDIILSNGNKISSDGYFTATFHLTGNSWKLRNMNWGIKAPEEAAR